MQYLPDFHSITSTIPLRIYQYEISFSLYLSIPFPFFQVPFSPNSFFQSIPYPSLLAFDVNRDLMAPFLHLTDETADVVSVGLEEDDVLSLCRDVHCDAGSSGDNPLVDVQQRDVPFDFGYQQVDTVAIPQIVTIIQFDEEISHEASLDDHCVISRVIERPACSSLQQQRVVFVQGGSTYVPASWGRSIEVGREHQSLISQSSILQGHFWLAV